MNPLRVFRKLDAWLMELPDAAHLVIPFALFIQFYLFAPMALCLWFGVVEGKRCKCYMIEFNNRQIISKWDAEKSDTIQLFMHMDTSSR
jgi:hypothetical protein